MQTEQNKFALIEQIDEVLAGLEVFSPGQDDVLMNMIKIRYENARSALRSEPFSAKKAEHALRFLYSANRAYVGDKTDLDNPLRQLLMKADKLLDDYLSEEKA